MASPNQRAGVLSVQGISTSPEALLEARPPSGPNRLWIAEVARERTRRGYFHFAFVLDTYTRRCIGWWPRVELGPDLLVRAVQMAVAGRWGDEEPPSHPSRHLREVALVLGRRCRAARIELPTWALAVPLEAAVAERFLSALRSDLGREAWPDRRHAEAEISAWIRRSYNLSPPPVTERAPAP